MSRHKYSRQQMFDCAREVVRGGTLKAAAEKADIEYQAAAAWRHRNDPEWNDVLERAREEYWQEEVSKKAAIFDLTLDQLRDRVTNGDLIYRKGEGLVRQPVAAKDLAVIGKLVSDGMAPKQKDVRSPKEASKSLDEIHAELESEGRENATVQ